MGALGLSLLSCGREVTAPQGGFHLAGRGMFSVEPQFPRLIGNASLTEAVNFQRVRVVLRRPDGSIALDTMIAFPPGADSVALSADVALAASTGNGGENFKLSLGYVNAAGDTVFKGGPVDVTILPRGSSASPPPPVQIPVVYSGTGASATSVRIAPRSLNVFPSDPFQFTAQALDLGGRAIAGTPIFWASADPSKVAFNSNLGGDGVGVGGRGAVRIFAQLLTGQVDTATVTLVPRVQRLEMVSGDLQVSAAGRTLANPLVVRVVATDGLPVSGITVTFAPAVGSVAPATAVTDAAGLASTRWTLPLTDGSVALVASVAGVTGAAGQVTFGAQSTVPRATKLALENSPPTTVAGTSLGTLRVSAKDSTGVLVPGTAGTVTVALSGAPEAARLAGTKTAAFIDGVATFGDLSVNLVGTGYTLLATTGALTPATSAPFAITEGPASYLLFTTQAASGIAGRPLAPMVVTAFDAQGNVATLFHGEVTLRMNVNPGAGTLGGTVTRVASNGRAGFDDLTVDRVGVGYTLAATATGLANGGTIPFDIASGAARRLQIARGGGQSAPPGTMLDTIMVALSDSLGNAVVGTPVGFAVTAGAGSVVTITGTTNASGIAKARWTLGPAAGTQQLTAGAAGLSLVVDATAVGSLGPGRMFLAFDTLNLTAGSSTGVSVFLSAAQALPVTVSLSTLDTLSQWTTASVVIPAGTLAATATVKSKLGVSGYSRAVASAAGLNADTLTLNILPASVRLLNSYLYVAANGDTLETQVVLSAPAPAGGVTVSFDLTADGVVHLAPSAGTRAKNPYNPCDARADEEREQAAAKASFAKLLSPATVFIKAGELSAYLYIIGDTAATITLTPIASGYGSQSATVDVYARSLYIGGGGSRGVAPGLRNSFYLSRQNAVRQESQAVSVIARTPGIVATPGTVVIRANENSQHFNVDALAVGSTWLVVQAAGFQPDSVEIISSPGKLITANYYPYYGSYTNVSVGTTLSPGIGVTDSAGTYAGSAGARYGSALTVSATSLDTSVVRPVGATLDIPVGQYQVDYPLRVVGTGTTTVTFTAPGQASASITVQGISNATLSYGGPLRLGVGQYQNATVSRSDVIDQTVPVTTVSSNPGVVSVDSISLIRAGVATSDGIRMVGRALGSANVTFSAPGHTASVQAISVSTPTFGHTTPSGLTLSSGPKYFQILTRDSTGTAHPVVSNLTVSIQSLNPAIARPDSIALIYADGYYTYANVYAVSAGATSLVITAPGYRPDTVPVTVGASSTPTLTIDGAAVVALGKKQRYSTYVYRNIADSAATVTLSKTGSATTASPATFAFGVGANYSASQLSVTAGSSSGQDLVMISAPGYVSDTLTVRVGTPKTVVYGGGGTVLVNYPFQFLTVYLTDSLGNARVSADTTRINVTSSDTTVAVTTPRVLTFDPGAYYQSIPVTYRGAGTVRFRLHEITSTYPDDSTALTTVQLPTLSFPWPMGYQPGYVGMRQRTDPGEMYISTNYPVLTNTVVKFARSTSALVSMPDSVVIPAGDNYAYFQITGADTVGSLQIVASSPGFASTTASIEVTRPALWVNTVYVNSFDATAQFEVHAIESGRYYARLAVENVPVSLALDTLLLGTLDSATITIPANELVAVGTMSVSGTAGRGQLRAWDARPIFRRYIEARENVQVSQGSAAPNENPLVIGIGQEKEYWMGLSDYTQRGLVLSLANSGLHTSRPGASADTVPASSYGIYKTFAGFSFGIDTVTISNPRIPTARWVLRVDSSTFELSGTRTVKLGDSLFVDVNLRNPEAGWASAAVPTSVTVTTSNGSWNANATDGASECTAAGATCTLSFGTGDYYMRGRFRPSSAGVARITVTGPGYRARSIDIQVTP